MDPSSKTLSNKERTAGMVKVGSGTVRPASIRALSTVTMLFGLMLTGFGLTFVVPSDHAVGVFATAAIGLGLSLCIATGIEAIAGIRNLVRVDILALWVLY